MKYKLQDRETGTVIDYYETYEQAEYGLELSEDQDKEDGNYTENFYEIVEVDCTMCFDTNSIRKGPTVEYDVDCTFCKN